MDQEELIINGLVAVPQKEVRLLLEVGYLYMEMQKNDPAKEVFEGVAALVPHSDVPHMALGHLYFAMGRFNPALKAHQQAVKLQPQSAAAHAHVGEILLFLRRPQEAMKALDKAMQLDPDGPAGEFAKYLKEAHSLGVFG